MNGDLGKRFGAREPFIVYYAAIRRKLCWLFSVVTASVATKPGEVIANAQSTSRPQDMNQHDWEMI